jgi:Glycosyl transferase family 2
MLDIRPGISAVLVIDDARVDLENVVLDLAAVLDGLVSDSFEIILVRAGQASTTSEFAADIQARRPRLSLHLVDAPCNRRAALSAGVDASGYDLVFVTTTDGQFEMTELNHLLEAIERGADLAIGYRTRRQDGILRRLETWTWKVLMSLAFGKTARDVDCEFKLFRRVAWERARPRSRGRTFNAQFLRDARRQGLTVTEVPACNHKPRPSPRPARPHHARASA